MASSSSSDGDEEDNEDLNNVKRLRKLAASEDYYKQSLSVLDSMSIWMIRILEK